ncbi:flagellar biosynthesis anti-sigma factor FlgM [Cupriavidus sp. AU9028]|uniref:flagellar biosynthesis anti-sigma factor FlgM n=1 Tax=Cupriavidus sp. AU9028 TaxID=2871157 RepID=UPI001C97E6C6|nr:flagellar biosynthesis anti-sigma factor FlgM [Cupriavidus sp. AU9028]
MKIHQSTTPRTGEGAAGSTARNTSAATPAPASAAAPAGGLTMSPLSAQVRDIGSSLVGEADNDIDSAKVEEIRQAIAEGRLKMDSSRIADGLLATLRELAQGASR